MEQRHRVATSADAEQQGTALGSELLSIDDVLNPLLQPLHSNQRKAIPEQEGFFDFSMDHFFLIGSFQLVE